MKCIILGEDSDIGKALKPMLEDDGWIVDGWRRDETIPTSSWDLIVCMLGLVAPVGLWYVQRPLYNFNSNLLIPLDLLQSMWVHRNPKASVCFMAGSNPQKIMPGYLSYNASKMALLKAVEQIDYETPDTKFFALGPGYVDTKIHKPTLDANWPNERISRGNPVPIPSIYDCLKWCLSQPKEVVGGRNICVSDHYGPELAQRLKDNHNLFKLRRVE